MTYNANRLRRAMMRDKTYLMYYYCLADYIALCAILGARFG